MLLITVATMALPRQFAARAASRRPRSAAPRRRRRCCPARSTNNARSPSPSKATPSRATGREHRVAQQLEMRRTAVKVDVAAVGMRRRWPRPRSPARRNSSGAIGVVAPLAQSTTIRLPASAPADGKICRQMSDVVSSEIGICSDCVRRPSADRRFARPRSASIRLSKSSSSFSPRPEKILMPLSSNGLCDAEITMPASNPSVRVR